VPARLRRLTLTLAALLTAGLLTSPATAAPGAAVTSPTDGATVRGIITLDADAPGAERVDYYVNGVRVAHAETRRDFSEHWDTRRALDGDYELVIRVDGKALGRPVEFTIDNGPVPPARPLVLPPHGESASFPECDSTGAHVVHPEGPGQYRPDTFQRRTVIDARGSIWTREQADDYPVLFKDTDHPPRGTVCWLGGRIASSEDPAASWEDVWHHTVGFYTDLPYTTIVGLRADNQGDCVAIKEPGDNSHTRLYGVALRNCHDDAIENDLMKNVTVTDSLIEGYVLFAFRGGSAGAEDGRNNFWTIDRVIGWVKPQEAVYKGPKPGTGPIFKRPNQDDEQGWEPRFTITDSIFRVDMEPNHGDLSIPPGPHSGNVIVWTGDGLYPGEVPPGFRVTTDLTVWSDARAAWWDWAGRQHRTTPGLTRP
jgi:hypothetical protein